MPNSNNQDEPKELVSLSERESLIRALPGFADLKLNEMSTLAGLMKEKQFNAGEKIVTEGEPLDAIYILVSGSAEVTKQVVIGDKTGETLLALINPGEAIGLKEAMFFSETGIRTATVTANVPCLLLKLSLNDLNQLLDTYPDLLQSLRSGTKWMLRMNLIKEAVPFKSLSNQRIAWLANNLTEVTVDAQDIIFNQGDPADKCFMIAEGNIEISVKQKDGTENVISVLKAGEMFGEAALLKAGQRNATARAATPAKLLVLNNEVILELTQESRGFYDELMSRVMYRHHPMRRQGILHQRRKMADDQIITTLKDPSNNNYIQLTQEGWFVWQQLNGQLGVEEITNLFFKHFGRFDPEAVLKIIHQLVDSGFADIDLLQSTQLSKETSTTPSRGGILQYFQFKYFLKKPDTKMDALYRKFGFIFSTIPMLFLIACLTVLGVIVFPILLDTMVKLIPNLNWLLVWIVGAIFVSMTLRLLNPLAMAFTIKRFHHTVPRFAIGWKILGPIAYIDTSDLWLASRWVKIAVILSGIGTDCLLAALLSCYAYYYADTFSGIFFFFCALIIYLQILRSLDPMLDLEGYQLITHALDAIKLREMSLNWLFQGVPGLFSNSLTLKNKRPIFIYILYCLLYLSLLLILASYIHALLSPYLMWSRAFFCLLFVSGFLFEMLIDLYYQVKIDRLLIGR